MGGYNCIDGATAQKYRHAPHNDVSVNDGLLKRRWSHKIMIYYNTVIQLCYNYLQYSVQ